MFPHRLTDSRAYDIAQAMLDGFNRHYRLFSETNREAKRRLAAGLVSENKRECRLKPSRIAWAMS